MATIIIARLYTGYLAMGIISFLTSAPFAHIALCASRIRIIIVQKSSRFSFTNYLGNVLNLEHLEHIFDGRIEISKR